MPRRRQAEKQVETLTHKDAKRKNIPTVEYEPSLHETDKSPVRVSYERRNRDLDPQLVWRGKDEQDWSDLVVQAPPLYIQEKIHPKAIIDDLKRQAESRQDEAPVELDLFADFNGLGDADKTEFYQHDQNWQNRMILGDSLQVMASLTEREGLRGQVQCIYIDPPYGIKFNSNWQVSTRSRDVKDSKKEHVTREPEQVKAFRDTWRHGIHSYLTYLRDRLTVARDLLTESGSIFVQIGDENVHRVRAVMDEVFGEGNFVSEIVCLKTSSQTSQHIAGIADFVLLYAKNIDLFKYRTAYKQKHLGEKGTTQYVWQLSDNMNESRISQNGQVEGRIFAADNLSSQSGGESTRYGYEHAGKIYNVTRGGWKTNILGMQRLDKSFRLKPIGNSLMYRRFLSDFSVYPIANVWDDVLATGLTEQKFYVVQTSAKIIQRCLLMTTGPGDLVLDPTCGSGTTAYVAEQWGRRWITIDTSRVALALARTRLMSSRYPYITLKSIANNAEIDVIWEKYQETLEPLRKQLNGELNQEWQEWEVPHEVDDTWPDTVKHYHSEWWKFRIERQQELDTSIAAKADFETLYDP